MAIQHCQHMSGEPHCITRETDIKIHVGYHPINDCRGLPNFSVVVCLTSLYISSICYMPISKSHGIQVEYHVIWIYQNYHIKHLSKLSHGIHLQNRAAQMLKWNILLCVMITMHMNTTWKSRHPNVLSA